MLMHGCKEGQCAACKSFVLDGEDIDLDRYSTFALPDFEKEEGYTLLCRAHVYEDVDDRAAQLRRGDDPLRRCRSRRSTPRWSSNELVTQDMHSLVLRLVEPTELTFFPGQYVDITIPGTETTRSFSMANTSSGERAARVHHQGSTPTARSPACCEGGLAVGDADRRRRPVRGVHAAGEPHVRPACSSAAVRGWRRSCRCCARWPSGAAPARPPTTTAPGAARDLCFEKELAELEAHLPDFRFVPALSEPDEDGWDGRGRAHHRRPATGTRTDLADVDAYVCGPPPMVEAAMETARATWGRPTSASTTTSSRRPHRPDQTTTERRVSDDHHPGAQRPQARTSPTPRPARRCSPTRPRAPSTTSPRASAAQRTTRTSPSTSSPTPRAT